MLSEGNCGIAASHIQHIQTVATQFSTFIFFRLANPNATRLIDAGYRTKRLDIHAKSSNWGPMAGFICADSALSKVADGGPAAIEHNQNAVRESLRSEQVGKIPLAINQARINELVNDGLFAAPTPAQAFNAQSPQGNANLRFALEQNGAGDFDVYYYPATTGEKTPVMVLGYMGEDGAGVSAVTSDYDLFAICPHFSAPEFASNIDTRVSNQGLEGILSRFQQTIIGKINRLCGVNPVINHGTELNNPSPENDPELAMFVPGTDSRLVRRLELPRIFGDLAMRGFHVYTNDRWNPAFKAHIGARVNQLRNPARRAVAAKTLGCLRETDFMNLSIAGFAGETRLAFAQQKFGEQIANNLASTVRPRWRF
ncbi:anthrax toxin-like adenylyl cyclase domain-containing protein [Paraburkholderia solisilvae]|uniref:Calmodulin-sensitive adenylate cyclase n=1 Tax=Paraburkholderia solisilvae TaxID=624376 RepID=A0A6J5EXI1_9BURK|nr:anthrax toxin-like adenylyl cyclase domain-containing protein [Paraburkholderia solisilvae]CAB3770121.1 Calmodulin-sensitive adenylate cyclase [Paraburkholderia solisilvae]